MASAVWIFTAWQPHRVERPYRGRSLPPADVSSVRHQKPLWIRPFPTHLFMQHLTGNPAQTEHAYRIFRLRLQPGLAQRYALAVDSSRARHGLDAPMTPVLAAMVVWESGADSSVVHAPTRWGRAIGLGGIMPFWWSRVCGDNLFNPEVNLDCTARALSWALEECYGNLGCAFRRYSYNATSYATRVGRLLREGQP